MSDSQDIGRLACVADLATRSDVSDNELQPIAVRLSVVGLAANGCDARALQEKEE